MSEERLQQVKKLMVALAAYYRTDLSAAQIAMYANDLVDLPMEQLRLAIERIRKNPNQKFFPLPAIIRQECLGNERDEALEASNRIVEALSRFGHPNPERARAFIGELGWRIVEREGGWQALCERVDNENLPTYKAQWRELARVTVSRARIGMADTAPALPQDAAKREQLPQHVKALLPEGMK